jgi:hypothetical protein
VLAPLAVAGGWLLRGRRTELLVLASTVLVVSVTTVLTYGNQRFRIAAEPAVLVLAAVALVTAARRVPGVRRAAV